MVDLTFGELLQKHLWNRNITEAQLAAELGKRLDRSINRSSVNRWLNSGTKPSPALLVEIPDILGLNKDEARALLKAAGHERLAKRLIAPESKDVLGKPEAFDIIAKALEPNESQHKELLDAAEPIHSLQTDAPVQINIPEEYRLNISKGRENTVIAINEDDQSNKAVTKPIIAQPTLVITDFSSRGQVMQAHPRLTIWGIPILILIILFWLGYSLIIKPFIGPKPVASLTAPAPTMTLMPTPFASSQDDIGNGSNVDIKQAGSISSTIRGEIVGEHNVSITQTDNVSSSINLKVAPAQTATPTLPAEVPSMPTPLAPSQDNIGSGSNVDIRQTGSISSTIDAKVTGTQPVRVGQVNSPDSSMIVIVGPEETAIPILEEERSLDEVIASTPLSIEFESEVWQVGTEVYFNEQTDSRTIAEVPSVSDGCALDIGGKFIIKAFYSSFGFRVERLVKDIDKLGMSFEHTEVFFDALITLYPDDNIDSDLLTNKEILGQFILSKHRSADDPIQAFLDSFQPQFDTTNPFKFQKAPSYPDYVIGVYSSYDGGGDGECHEGEIIAVHIAQLKEMSRSLEEVTSIKN